MDEGKKFKGDKQSSPIDGFISDARPLGLPGKRSIYQPKRGHSTPSLGSVMRLTDGFYPLRASQGGIGKDMIPEVDEAALLDAPIELDNDSIPKKKYRFGFQRPKVRKVAKRAGLVLGALVLLLGVYFAAKIYITERHLFRGGGKAPALAANVDINQLKGEGDGRVNILLLGIGGVGHDGADLTDTMMLASIDPINHSVGLLSIPRDLWVKMPPGSFVGNYQKINAAYESGKYSYLGKEDATSGNSKAIQAGFDTVDSVVSGVLGVPIHYNVLVDFQAFQQSVDSIGCVSINVPTELYDPTVAWENHNSPIVAKPGVQTMCGQQALLYARSRETSSDFARGERQRALMVAIKDKTLTLGTFSNPVKVSNLLSSLGTNVYSDFSLGDISRLYQIAQQIPSASIKSLDLDTPPNQLVTTADINGLSAVEPLAGPYDYSAIQSYVRNTLKDSFIAKENAQIAVYNATDVAGVATSEGTLLKSYGYSVTTIANTTVLTNPAKTTLVDLTKGKDKYTRHYLEQRFSVSAVSTIPKSAGVTAPTGTSFVIILGRDVATSG